MDAKYILVCCLAVTAGSALAQRGGGPSDDQRWNITGPAWYDTKCGHVGFSVRHGLPSSNCRQPCSGPIRVCGTMTMPLNSPAVPDGPCQRRACTAECAPRGRCATYSHA